MIYLLVYVDDIIIIGTSSTIIKSTIQQLSTYFALKELGDLLYFLGVGSEQDF